MFRDTGFDPVEETRQYTTIAGTLALYQARKPFSQPNPEVSHDRDQNLI